MVNFRKRITSNIYFQYCCCFAIVGILIFAIVFASGSTLIWNSDGITQHYPALVYWRKMLRGLIFHHHLWNQWDWNLGLGQDTIQTFSYYVMGDIFTYPSVFFHQSQMVTYYSVMVIIRLFLAGWAFIFSARHLIKRAANWTIIAGSLVYLFSGYSAYVTFAHPFFINPLIITPLLVYALHRALITSKMGLLSLMTAWTLFNNFYLGAIMGVGMAIYWLILVLSQPQWRNLKTTVKLVISVLIGVLASCALLLPSLYQLTISTRTSNELANGMTWYPLSYYLTLPGLSVSNYARPYWVTGGILVLGIIAVTWSLRRFKRYPAVNWSILTGGVVLLSPILAALINGGSSPSNRWTFLLMMPIACAVVVMLNHLDELQHQDFIWMGVVGVIITVSLFAGNKFKFTYDLGSVMALYFGTVASLAFRNLPVPQRMQFSLTAVIIITITGLNAVIMMRDRHTNQFSTSASMLISDSAAHQLTNTQQAYAQKSSDDTSRTLVDGQLRTYTDKSPADNLPILAQTKNINSYWSLQNNYLNSLNNALENNTTNPNDTTNTADYRSLVLRYLGVSRLFMNDGNLSLPSGYDPTGDAVNAQHEYVAHSTVPLIYRAAGTMSTSQFKQLDPSQREVALLSNLITNQVKGQVDQSLLKKIVQITTSVLPTNAQKIATVHHISAHLPTTKLTPTTLSWEADKSLKGYELHARLTNIKYSAGTFQQRHQDALTYYIQSHNQDIMMAGQETDLRYNPTLYSLNWLKKNVMSYSAATGAFKIGVKYGAISNEFVQTGINDLSFYTPHSSTTLNLGTINSTDDSSNQIQLTLPSSGKTSFDITLWAVPTQTSADRAIARNKPASHIKMIKNGVSATYRATKSDILATTIPYSKGWHVTDTSQTLPRVNKAFIGIPVHAGTNHIKLVYRTPLAHTGLILSIIGILLLSCLVVIEHLWPKRLTK